MSARETASPALSELKRFLEYLSGVWGLFAGITTLFPLSNILVKVVPTGIYPDGGFAYVPVSAVSVVATICCIFVVFWTFGQRELAASWSRPFVHRKAWRSFIFGVAALMVYLAAYVAIDNDFYWVALHWESGSLRRLSGDMVLLALYATFFALLTRAFVLLALFEYVKSHDAGLQRRR